MTEHYDTSHLSTWVPEFPYGGTPSWREPHVLNAWPNGTDVDAVGPTFLAAAQRAVSGIAIAQTLIGFAAFIGALLFLWLRVDAPTIVYALGVLVAAGWGPGLFICGILEIVKRKYAQVIRSAEA